MARTGIEAAALVDMEHAKAFPGASAAITPRPPNAIAFDAPYVRLYDLFYADKDYGSEAAYLSKLLRKHAPAAQRLLEFGSGTGRHSALLASEGYSVHGIERSPAMLAAATDTAAAGCKFTFGDIRNVRLGMTFDAVVSLFHVMSYQTSNHDLAAAFATARAHLAPGGCLIFDYWYGPAVLHQKPAVRIKRVDDDLVEATRIGEPTLFDDQGIVAVDYDIFARHRTSGTISRHTERHRLRYLFLPELELLLSAAGFQLELSREWLTGRPLSLQTWNGVSIARAV